MKIEIVTADEIANESLINANIALNTAIETANTSTLNAIHEMLTNATDKCIETLLQNFFKS